MYVSTYEPRHVALPGPPAPPPRGGRLRPAARHARPDDRRHRAPHDRARPRRLVAVPVGGDRVPRAGHGRAAGLRAAVGPPRAAGDAADRHGPVPHRLGAVRRRAGHAAADRLPRAPGPGRRRARGPLLHPRRGPLRRPPQRLPAGHAGRPHGPQLHRRPARRWLPRRPRRVALGLPREPADRHRRAGGGGGRPPGLDRPQRARAPAARPRRDRRAHPRGRAAARRAQRAHARAVLERAPAPAA